MSCDICGRGACVPSFHSLEEQERFEKAIDAFERARAIRQAIRDEITEEEKQTEEQES